MKYCLFVLLVVCGSPFLFGQRTALAPTSIPLSEVEQISMPIQSNKVLQEQELQRRGPGVAPKFAESIPVRITPQTHGTWEQVRSGDWVWRVRIFSQDAYSLNLGFTQYHMPSEGKLFLYTPDLQNIQGPFYPATEETHDQLWTPILKGEEIVIEVQLPAYQRADLRLELGFVNHDFMDFFSPSSQSCNLDVICGAAEGWPEVDNYRDVIQSVAVISIGGTFLCSGFLINNARQDCKPYFMTASHCGLRKSNQQSLVVYWNYENSSCRQPRSAQSGARGDGSLADFNTGSTVVANYEYSDFTLALLNKPVSATANAFFAGWNKSTELPKKAVCVHHPNTDEKRISFENDPCFIADENDPNTPDSTGNVVIISDWDVGTTEGGSSGAPLFNESKQVIGQLYFGEASCNNNAYDAFGWFHISWEGGGTPETRLKDWLDPDDLGLTSLDGRWHQSCDFSIVVDNAAKTVCASQSLAYRIQIDSSFRESVLLTVQDLPLNATASFSQNPAPSGSIITLTISNIAAVTPGAYLFSITATANSLTQNIPMRMTVFSDVTPTVQLRTPIDKLNSITDVLSFSWVEAVLGTTYDLQIATDRLFQSIVINATNLTEARHNNVQLESSTEYFWRVRARTPCGLGQWSEVFSFTTAQCRPVAVIMSPIAISPDSAGTYISELNVPFEGIVVDVDVINLRGRHTWINDLTMYLTSPSGQRITLFDQICFNEDDFYLTLDDEAATDRFPCPPFTEERIRPEEPLATFAGEQARGKWKLTVVDHLAQDGGLLQGWSLRICTAQPSNLKVLEPTNVFETCVGDNIEFQVEIGSNFNTSGVQLSVGGLPAGAQASFSKNPAQPGDTVTVTIDNFQPNTLGSYPLSLSATDGGISGSAAITIQVNDLPIVPVLRTPLDGAINVPFSTEFSWNDVPGVTSYWFELALDSTFNTIIEQLGMVNNAYRTTLDFGARYYWRITARNDCGETISPVASFTTMQDLSITLTPVVKRVCTDEPAVFTVSIGSGFSPSGATLGLYGLPLGINYVFSENPVFPGTQVEIKLTPFLPTTVGIHTISVFVFDSTTTATTEIMLIIEATPDTPILLSPLNDAMQTSTRPELIWQSNNPGVEYLVELARDIDFMDIVEAVRQADTLFKPTTALELNTLYFWRVTALNSCGTVSSQIHKFTTSITSAVASLEENQLYIFPNPAQDKLFITFERGLSEAVQLAVFTIDGKLVEQLTLSELTTHTTLPLEQYPSGMYLLKFSSGKNSLSKRVVVQR